MALLRGSSLSKSLRSAQEVSADAEFTSMPWMPALLHITTIPECFSERNGCSLAWRQSVCGAGGWRTLSEWQVMFKKAGFTLEKSEAVGASMHLMVWNQI